MWVQSLVCYLNLIRLQVMEELHQLELYSMIEHQLESTLQLDNGSCLHNGKQSSVDENRSGKSGCCLQKHPIEFRSSENGHQLETADRCYKSQAEPQIQQDDLRQAQKNATDDALRLEHESTALRVIANLKSETASLSPTDRESSLHVTAARDENCRENANISEKAQKSGSNCKETPGSQSTNSSPENFRLKCCGSDTHLAEKLTLMWLIQSAICSSTSTQWPDSEVISQWSKFLYFLFGTELNLFPIVEILGAHTNSDREKVYQFLTAAVRWSRKAMLWAYTWIQLYHQMSSHYQVLHTSSQRERRRSPVACCLLPQKCITWDDSPQFVFLLMHEVLNSTIQVLTDSAW